MSDTDAAATTRARTPAIAVSVSCRRLPLLMPW